MSEDLKIQVGGDLQSDLDAFVTAWKRAERGDLR